MFPDIANVSNKRTEPASKFVSLPNGLVVHYRESGKGETPVLFIPGWTMTVEVFCRQFAFFESSSAFRFISLDPRSHGQTTSTHDGNHYEQHGRDIHEFIAVMELENVVLCGWSFATLSTLSYVNQFGYKKLSGFIMLDGPPRATGAELEEDWVTYSYNDADGFQEFCTMGKLRDPENTNLAFAHWLLEDKNPEAIEWLIQITQQTPNEVAALLNATAVFLDYSDDLRMLGEQLPVWCVVRQEQRQLVFKWCSTNLPSARLSAFGGHMMFWEQPDRFCNLLLEFVESVGKSK